jgi:hypothetical protein
MAQSAGDDLTPAAPEQEHSSQPAVRDHTQRSAASSPTSQPALYSAESQPAGDNLAAQPVGDNPVALPAGDGPSEQPAVYNLALQSAGGHPVLEQAGDNLEGQPAMCSAALLACNGPVKELRQPGKNPALRPTGVNFTADAPLKKCARQKLFGNASERLRLVIEDADGLQSQIRQHLRSQVGAVAERGCRIMNCKK